MKTSLVEQGRVDGARLTTRGFGFDRPRASNDTEVGRAQNRRAEVLLTSTAAPEEPPPSP